jgi:beta-glucanase (GH16 family)
MIKAKATRTLIGVVIVALATAVASAASPWARDRTTTTTAALPHVMPAGVPLAQVGSLRTYLDGDGIAAAWKPLRYNTCNGMGAIRWSDGQLHLSTDGTANNGAAVISPGPYTSGIFEAKINFAAAADGKIADWPAFWLSSGASGKLAWPYGGELDAAEGLGGSLGITYHYNANGPDPTSPDAPTNTATYQVTTTPGWHVVTVVWTAHRFDVYYQGTLVKTISGSFVQNSPMNVIFDMTAGQPGHQPGQPASMDVAYVRIWAVN